jgi:hypothetical protein
MASTTRLEMESELKARGSGLEHDGFVGRWIDLPLGCLDLLRLGRDLVDLSYLNPACPKLVVDHVQSNDVKVWICNGYVHIYNISM